MFSLFKKKERPQPDFTELENSALKNMYFSRTTQWDWLDSDTIYVIDNNSPRVTTMDPWPQLVYMAANGQQSVCEFVHGMAAQYGAKEPTPKDLDTTVLQVLQSLLDNSVLALHTSPTALPYYLELSVSEQDADKARQLMLSDGFIKG